MKPIKTFTSRRKLEAYMGGIWPDSLSYAVLDGAVHWVRNHNVDGRIYIDEYNYEVFAVPSGTQAYMTEKEAKASIEKGKQ